MTYAIQAVLGITLLHSRKPLLYSETHYPTQEVAGVTKNSPLKKIAKRDNLVTVSGHLSTPILLCSCHLLNWLALFLYTTSNKAYNMYNLISTYINAKMFVCLSACLCVFSRCSRPFEIRLVGYTLWHKLDFCPRKSFNTKYI